MTKKVLAGSYLCGWLMVASAFGQKLAFLGTSPQVVAQPPVAAASILSIGVDAAGDEYYAESAGHLVRMTAGGGMTTITSGLKQASIAVDYRGNVYVADTGNKRVFSVQAGSNTPVVRANVAASSIAADVNDDFFYLANDVLFEVVRNGKPVEIGTYPGARLVAYGPATGEEDTLYILSESGDTYTVSTYTYHNASGTKATGQTFNSTDSVSSFVVDAAGNLIFTAGTGTASYVFQISPSGQRDILTQIPSGLQSTLAMDTSRNLYYVDSTGLNEVMRGTLNFGSVGYTGRGNSFQQLSLNFSVPPGLTVARDGYSGGSFFDADDPSPGSCSPGVSSCFITVTYIPSGGFGIDSDTMVLFDPSGKQLFQLPLYGRGVFGASIMFPTGTTVATAKTMSLAPNLKTPAGISNDAALIADPGTGTVSGIRATGLGRPQGVAHSPITGSFVTQSGMAGILRVAADGTQSRVGERLVTEPNGVAVDDAGNLYISDRSAIFRIGIDGTETELANSLTDGGYTSVQSITCDGAGNVYAFFTAGGPDGKGGLIEISPVDEVTPIALPETIKSAAALGIDDGGGLYFGDLVSHTLTTLRPDGGSTALITGFNTLKGVSGVGGPMAVDQGKDALYSLPALSFNILSFGQTEGNNSIDFGNVAVGTSVSKTYTVLSLGSEPAGVDFTPAGPSDFKITMTGISTSNGGSQTVTVTYKPTTVGAVSVMFFGGTLMPITNDDEPFIYLTGTGVSASK